MSDIPSFIGNKCTDKGSEEMDGSCCSSLPMWITALSSSNILCIKIWLFSLTEINIYIYASSMYFSQKEKRIIYLPTNIQESACCRTCSRELARIQKRLKCFWLARVPRFAPVTLSSTKRTLGGGGGTWVWTGAFWSVLSSCVRQPAMANVRHRALGTAWGTWQQLLCWKTSAETFDDM